MHIVTLAQARLVLNGAKMKIAQGAYLVIDNAAANAITRNGGHIISEGENNMIKWNIGTATGSYLVPLGSDDTHYIPVSFTKGAGTGSGYFLFSTYGTGWQNSLLLPASILQFNGAAGTDKSAYATDRFWQINAQGYTVKPALSNLMLTYLDSEFAAPNATTTESNLSAQRWNSTTSTWVDYAPVATTDATGNTVTIASVADTDLYPWWVVDYIQDRHWVASSASNWNDPQNWSTTAGGPGGAGVPLPIDAVIFNDVNDASFALDADVVMESLTMESGYSGTITQGAHSITTTNGATLAGGTFSGGSADIVVNGPFVLSGTNFTSSSATLELKDDFIATSETFVHNNGTVKFSGTTGTQDISGTSVVDFNNILVTNTSASPGVSIQSSQNLKGVLSLGSNVVVDADGSSNTAVFKLISTADSPTRDAAIDILPPGAQVTGNVTVQRYLSIEGPNSGRIYRYISSPIQNASVSDIQQEISVTGSFTGTSSCSGCKSNQSMFEYDESALGNLNTGYVDFPSNSNTETLTPGKGYALYVRGNIMSTALWDVRGTITAGNSAPVSLPTTFTSSGSIADDGWNLVGNPFPSTIDWDAPNGWTKANLNGVVYMRDNGGAATQISSWNSVIGTNGGSRFIPTGQGFWVKATTGSPVLQANENVKAAGTQSSFFRTSSYVNLIRITMVQGSLRDETVIHFRPDATDWFDPQADAWKLRNGIFNFSSILANGDKLAINSLPAFNCSKTVHLDVSDVEVTTYSLEFSEFESFSSSVDITLQDNFTNTSFDVRSGTSFSFSVTSDPLSYGPNRFEIIFQSTGVPSADFLIATDNICEGSDAVILLSNTELGASYTAFSGSDPLGLSVNGNDGDISLVIPADSLRAGENFITIRATIDNCGSSIEKAIAFEIAKKQNVISVEQGRSCGEGYVVLKAHGATGNGYFNWYESATAEMPIANQNDSTFSTPVISKSRTYFVSIVNEFGCEGQRSPVLAEVVQFAAAQIYEHQDSLQSNYTKGNQWYFDSEMINGATKQSINVGRSGIYSVKIDTLGCNTSADYQLVITGVEQSSELTLSVFPNPVIEEVNIEIPTAMKGITSLRIVSMHGKTMDVISREQFNGNKSIRVDMKHYPAGVYVIHATGAVKDSEIKLVKQ